MCMYFCACPDFDTFGVTNRTFFVPGLGGFGSGSAMYYLLPYFAGLTNIDVVDVGPFSTNTQRADVLEQQIRKAYPQWSSENPINLVGHSMGCNTILELVSRKNVDPASIRTIVNLSPCLMGLGTTCKLGRNARVVWWIRIVLTMMMVYEYIVPLCLRQTILWNTMLPGDLPWFDTAVAATTILCDIDEKRAEATCGRALQHIAKHKIRLHTIVAECTEPAIDGGYGIPWAFGSQYIIRLLHYVLGVGQTSDYETGYSLMSDDVSQYLLRPGNNDGVLLAHSQGTCLDNVVNPIRIKATHLNTVFILPETFVLSTSSSHTQTMVLILGLLIENQ